MRTMLTTLLLLATSLAGAGDTVVIGADSVQERLAAQDPTLVMLDVRTADEYAAGHVPGARLLPYDEIEARVGELEEARDKDVVVYCRSGRRAEIALESLRAAGFTRLFHLEGDWLGWTAAGREAEGPPPAQDPTD